MASTASTRVRAELIGEFEKTNAWATSLNAAIQRLDDAIGQFTTIALVGNYTLTSANFITDEARAATLRFTGTGTFTVTAPAVSYGYVIINDCTGDLTLKPSGGTGDIIRAGTRAIWVTDGTTGYTVDPTLDKIKAPVASVAMNGQKLTGMAAGTAATDGATLTNRIEQFTAPTGPLSMNSQKITSLATPTVATDAANKSYVDGFAFNSALPGGTAAGQVAIYNGTAPVWGAVDLADSDARTGLLPATNGGTGAASLTAHSVVTGGGTGAVNLVAPGASGTVLTSNGAGVAATFQAASQAGLILISTQSPAAVASVDFTSGLTSTYDEYELHIINLKPASDAALWLRTSSNSGSSFDAGASDYDRDLSGSSLTDSKLLVGGSTSIAAAEAGGFSGVVSIFRPSVSKPCQFYWRGVAVHADTNAHPIAGAGQRRATGVVNALRLLFSTGNIASGFVALYGIRKT